MLAYGAVAAGAVVHGVGPVGIVVGDLDRAIEFYREVLMFEPLSTVAAGLPDVAARIRRAHLRLGTEQLELIEYVQPRGRRLPADSRSNDGWFQHVAIVVSDMGEAYERLRHRNVRHISSRPQRLPDWNPNAGGIEAFYFQDPDGHALELLRFPPDKRAAKWRAGSGLFLGIDHTAIAVADTSRSLAFYRDTLGLTSGGESENYGTEQEELSGVRGARVRITSLHARTGPGIELLEYRVPRNGRPYPADTGVNDLWNWRTTLFTRDPDAVARTLRTADTDYNATVAAPVAHPARGLGHGLLVRDPDGHAMEIITS